MIPGAIESIDGDVLSRLLSTGVLESRTLEFKRDLTGGANDDKKEFLADVTALANTLGGDLIYGVDEAAGIVSAAVGVVVEDKDAAQLRLEQLLRHGVEPRMAGVGCTGIPSGLSLPEFRRAVSSSAGTTPARALGRQVQKML